MGRFAPRGFYAIADVPAWPEGPPDAPGGLLERAHAILAAGPCCLQLRCKQEAPTGGGPPGPSDRQICELGGALRAVCHEAGVPFCLNDRVDLALLIGADVVHIGQEDLPLEEVRRVLDRAGGELSVGVSTHTLPQVRAALAGGADYLGYGPVFDTRSKDRPDPTVGLAGLRRAVGEAGSVPVVAIGGIDVGNVAEVVAAGASACAVIGAVWRAGDPGAAAAALVSAFAGPDRV